MTDLLARVYLLEALDLLASYLFRPGVELGPTAVGTRDEGDEETRQFLQELEARHALAAAGRLQELLPDVERRASSTSVLRREDSKGVLRGRLDMPRYLARRGRQRFGVRTYPVIVTASSADTPENGLVAGALRGLARQLDFSVLSGTGSAEGEATAIVYDWVQARTRRLPWAAVARYAPVERLALEATQRVRKRQTGNDAAYDLVVTWSGEWRVDIARLGVEGRSRVIDGLLAFPAGEPFWNKVFEVWCLREVARALARVGCTPIDGPRPLHERGRGPIYRFRSGGDLVDLWFQRQEPMGAARWRYEGGRALRGWPDIVVASTGRVPFVVDAKRRPGSEQSQSEEIYKVLGYAENFAEGFGGRAFRSALLFPGQVEPRALEREDDRARVAVLFFPDVGREQSEAALDAEVRAWLRSREEVGASTERTA